MYREYFGFERMPFANTADPMFFYKTAEHEEALAALIYGVTQRRGITVVTGQPGSGKTLLGLMLLRALRHDAETATVLHTPENGHELFVTLCREFGIRCRHGHTTGELLDRLRGFLEARYDENRCVVALIDEAQNMNPETLEHLRMLGNIEKDSAKLLQIVLTGQPQLARTLQHPHLEQLRQRIFCSCQLKPLQRDQTRNYLRHRLAVAGVQDKQLFTDEAVDLIHDRSGGLPRMINQIADNALLAAYSAGLKSIDRTVVNNCINEMMSLQIVHSTSAGEASANETRPSTVLTGGVLPNVPAPPPIAAPSETQLILGHNLSHQLTESLRRGSEVVDRLEEATRHATRRTDEVRNLLDKLSGTLEELEQVRRSTTEARQVSREGLASFDHALTDGRRVVARLRKAKDHADAIVQDLNRKISDLNERHREQARQLDEKYQERLREFEQRIDALLRMNDQDRSASESIAREVRGQIEQVLAVSNELNNYRDQAAREIAEAIQKVRTVTASVREETEKARLATEQSVSATQRIGILMEQAERCAQSLERFTCDGRQSLDALRRQAEKILPDARDMVARLADAVEGASHRERILTDVTTQAEACQQAVAVENERFTTLLGRLEERLGTLRAVLGESDRRAEHLNDILRQADAVMSEALSCTHRLDEKIATAGRQEQDLASATQAAESTLSRLIRQVSEQANFLQEQARSASEQLTGQIIAQSRQWQSRVDHIENLPDRLSAQVEQHTVLLNTRMREVQAASERLAELYEKAMASCGPTTLHALSEAQKQVRELTAEVSSRCAEMQTDLQRQVEQARSALQASTATTAEQTRKAEAACADIERNLRLLEQQINDARQIARGLDEQADTQARDISRRMMEVESTAENFAEETRQRCRILQERIGAAEAATATAAQQTRELEAVLHEAEPATNRLVECCRQATLLCGPDTMEVLERRTREMDGLLERLREEGHELRAVADMAASLCERVAVSTQKGAEQQQVLTEAVAAAREQVAEARTVTEACNRQTLLLAETSAKQIEESTTCIRELAALLELSPSERERLQAVAKQAAVLHEEITTANQQGAEQNHVLREVIDVAAGVIAEANRQAQTLETMLHEAGPATERLTESYQRAMGICGPEAMQALEQQRRELEEFAGRLREGSNELRAVMELAAALCDRTAVATQKGAEQQQVLTEAVTAAREQVAEARTVTEVCNRQTLLLAETNAKQIEETIARTRELAALLDQAPGQRDKLQAVVEGAGALHEQMIAATQQAAEQCQALREEISAACGRAAEARAATEACSRQTRILTEATENQERELTKRLQELARGMQQLRLTSEHAGRMLQQVEEGTTQAAEQADVLRQWSRTIEGQIKQLTERAEQAGDFSVRLAELNESARQVCGPEAMALLESKCTQLRNLLDQASAQSDGLSLATETAVIRRQELVEQNVAAETTRQSLREVLETAGRCSERWNELAENVQRQLADLDKRMTEARTTADRLMQRSEEESGALSRHLEQADAVCRRLSEQLGEQTAAARTEIEKLTDLTDRSADQEQRLHGGIHQAAELAERLAEETSRQEQMLRSRIGEAEHVAQGLAAETAESAEFLREQIAEARMAFEQLAELYEQARQAWDPRVREALSDKQREIEHLLERTTEQCGQLWAMNEATEALRGRVDDSVRQATDLDALLSRARASADEKLYELRQLLAGLEEKSETFTTAGQRQVRELSERIDQAARQVESLDGFTRQAVQIQTNLQGVLENARASSETFDRLADEAGRKLQALAARIEQADRAAQALAGQMEDQAETLGVQIKEAEHISGTLCTQLDERGRYLDTRIEKATEAAGQITALLREEGRELQNRLQEARQATDRLNQEASQHRANFERQRKAIEEAFSTLLKHAAQREQALRAGVESAQSIAQQMGARISEEARGLEARLEQINTSAIQIAAQAEAHAQAFAAGVGEAEAVADRLSLQAEQQSHTLDGKIGEARTVAETLDQLCDRAVELCDAAPLQELENRQSALRDLLEQAGGQCRALQSAARSAESQIDPLTAVTRQAEGLREQLLAQIATAAQAERQGLELRELAGRELAELREQIQAVKAASFEISQAREQAERAEGRCAERAQEIGERLDRADEQWRKLQNGIERAEKVVAELGRNLQGIQQERKEAEAARRGLLRERVLADAAANKLMELRRDLAAEVRRSPALMERLRESRDKGRSTPAMVAERSTRALDPLRALRNAEIAPPRPSDKPSVRLNERIQDPAESGVSV